MEEQASQPQVRPALAQKPKRTVTLGACVACRKRKSKKDTPCIYELGPNEKPSQAMKRKNEEMQGELSNLRHLYDMLRFRPEPEALAILHKIRAESPDTSPSQRIQNLTDFVRNDPSNPLPPPTSIEALLHPATDGSSDPRLKATHNWTTITKDSRFLTLLMTLWHKWEYSYYHYLDWDIFLDDLASGRSDFCSELLVNALLASASFHSSLVKNRSKPFGDSMISRFYREARRLWEAEEGEDNLARIQAALALFMVFGKHGRDKVGYMFLQEACRIARQLGLFRLPSPSSIHRPPHIPQERWERARAVTAWALFNFQLTMSFIYSLSPMIKSPPPVAIPYDENPDSEALFKDECARSVVLLECLNTLFDPDDPVSDLPPKPEQTEILYLRLKLWFDHRRPSLDPVKHPSPENLLTAMQYYVSVIRLFQPFTNYESSHERIKSYRDQAFLRTSAATKELRQLIFRHDTLHGWAATITIVLHPIVVTVFGSIDEISRQPHPISYSDTNEAYRGLLTCLNALSTIATYNFYAQPLFRLLTQSCQGLAIPLPDQLVSVSDRFKSEEWTKNAASMVSSQYIADMRKVATGMENARMDSIVSQWDAMTLKDVGGVKREEA
ncbi:hypothetical protein N0V90_008695 [Kalmusia sp. IMI 367209]|nr:hypothetical protein N0V90_008695 [Kalmusia sp. IMI 367209]